EDASWDDERQYWRLATTSGVFSADFLVAAMGPFSEPAVPGLPGLDPFEGSTYHSADWIHDDTTVSGRRVAVVGTGASAVQFIPRLQPKAEHLTVFQRTPTWVLPHPDRPLGRRTKTLFTRLPQSQRWFRNALNLVFEAMT